MRKRIATLCTIPLLLNPMLSMSSKVQQTPLASEQGDCIEILNLKNELHRQVEEYEKVQWQNANTIEYEEWLEEQKIKASKLVPVTFEVSFYCSCSYCTGYGTGITASGKTVSRGLIALPKDIRFGTKAHIDGLGTFVNEDTGSHITYTPEGYMRVDIFVESHSEALEYGRFLANGYLEYE